MKHINLRLPDNLHAAVSAAAEREHRSLNNMVLRLIESGLGNEGAPDHDGRGHPNSQDPR